MGSGVWGLLSGLQGSGFKVQCSDSHQNHLRSGYESTALIRKLQGLGRGGVVDPANTSVDVYKSRSCKMSYKTFF